MNFIKTKLKDVIIIEPKVIRDDRGYFFESFNKEKIERHIGKVNFVQDNESKSQKGVLRGLHFQTPPFSQAKLIRCIKGEILDVSLDLRKESPTYGEHLSVELSEDNKRQVYIPRGFAHGFVVLSEEAIVAYKVDNDYAPMNESGIIWNDKELQIDWRISSKEVKLSEKDKMLSKFTDFVSPF